jgi:hypothetical protein
MNTLPQQLSSRFVLVPLILACALIPIFGGRLDANTGKTLALAGTTWSGTDSDGDHYVFTFEPDGTLAYKSPTGSFRNGKWSQFKTSVYFEMNDHVSEYLGAIADDDIEGKAWNSKKARKWTWKVRRDKGPGH